MKAPSVTHKLQSANDAPYKCLSGINEMKIGQPITVKTAQPTADKTPKKIIDLGNTSSEDLKSIKKLDPFMFHSIPGARCSSMLMQDIDTTCLVGTSSSRRSSCPGRFQSAQSNEVTRSTCISVEAHPDLLLEDDLLDGVDEDFDLDFTHDDFSDLDLLLRFYG